MHKVTLFPSVLLMARLSFSASAANVPAGTQLDSREKSHFHAY
ncbi:hypothetical protein [Xenorhabdus littoralis]|nr:hypothetical protein [Xenorhabdus sp. psl]